MSKRTIKRKLKESVCGRCGEGYLSEEKGEKAALETSPLAFDMIKMIADNRGCGLLAYDHKKGEMFIPVDGEVYKDMTIIHFNPSVIREYSEAFQKLVDVGLVKREYLH